MRIKFLAKGFAPKAYDLGREAVNGLDLSVVKHGGKITLYDGDGEPTALKQAGVCDVWRDEQGELHVVLCQMPPVTSYFVRDGQVIENREGDWRESDWIDAADYVPGHLYIVEASDA